MHLFPEQLVEQIHDAPLRIVLAVAGGGSRAIADLVEVPGCSRTLLEAVVPYAGAAMTEWLGGKPDAACSSNTARALAMTAFFRAQRHEAAEDAAQGRPQTPPSDMAGVACTASLASDRPKRGPHRMHIALQTVAETAVWSLELQKGRRTRAEEERLTGRLLLNIVAEAAGVADRLALELLEGEQVQEVRARAPAAWQALLLGQIESVRVGPEVSAAVGPPQLILPGAFNPLHAGHCRMFDIAREMLQQPAAAFELSILNVEKPALDYMEIERRLGQFAPEQTIYLTRSATFEEKSRLFPGATFIVGVDTLRRIVAPQYHGGSESACQKAVEQIISRGCRFLVFGRDLGAGFVRLGELDLPESLRTNCREVPPEVFREDISSTAIRREATR